MSFCACCIDVEHGLKRMRRPGKSDVWLCWECRHPHGEFRQAAKQETEPGIGQGNKRTLVVG